MEHCFLGQLGLDWRTRAPLLLRPNDIPELGPPRLAHLKAMEYVRYKYVTKEQFEQYFKFSFVRDPRDRLVSMYKHLNMHHVCDFKTFVMRKLANGMYRSSYWFICPQHEYLCDDNGELLMDFVGRFEQLESDFLHVGRELDIENPSLPHVNEGGAHRILSGGPKQVLDNVLWWAYRRYRIPVYANYKDYYDSETKEFVEEVYATDIGMFGYGSANTAA